MGRGVRVAWEPLSIKHASFGLVHEGGRREERSAQMSKLGFYEFYILAVGSAKSVQYHVLLVKIIIDLL